MAMRVVTRSQVRAPTCPDECLPVSRRSQFATRSLLASTSRTLKELHSKLIRIVRNELEEELLVGDVETWRRITRRFARHLQRLLGIVRDRLEESSHVKDVVVHKGVQNLRNQRYYSL
mgnify:CR=1 FL=1